MTPTSAPAFVIAGILALLAQTAAAERPRVYSSYDDDLDGYLDTGEFERFAERFRNTPSRTQFWQFDRIDIDGDGRISEQELVEALQRQPAKGGGDSGWKGGE